MNISTFGTSEWVFFHKIEYQQKYTKCYLHC